MAVPEQRISYPSCLTRREVEILRLNSAGRAEREIAEDLIIGVRITSIRVGTILNETGGDNRVEAASYPNHQGPIPSVSENESRSPEKRSRIAARSRKATLNDKTANTPPAMASNMKWLPVITMAKKVRTG